MSLFFRQSIPNPISSNIVIFEGQDICLAEKSGPEPDIFQDFLEILDPGDSGFPELTQKLFARRREMKSVGGALE